MASKVIDDITLEAVGEIPDIERDSELVGNPSSVARVLQGAAATRRLAQGGGGARQREVNPHDIVTRVANACGSHRRIDAAAHRRHDPHHAAPRARRARATASGSAVSTASTSACVVVCPIVSRMAPRASSGSIPMANST